MKKMNMFCLLGILFLSVQSFAGIKPTKVKLTSKKTSKKSNVQKISHKDIKSLNDLEKAYKVEMNNKDLDKLKIKTLKLANKAVPMLIKIMKNDDYPDKSRWAATFMLGKIMGKKSAPFIARFCEHPNWVMRLSSLKALEHLDQKQYLGLYAKKLQDKSLIVRTQALDMIRNMKLTKLAPSVWAMLFDKSNYAGSKGQRKRADIIKDIIKTVGDLKFEKAKAPLLKMIQNKKYKDVFTEIDYSLEKIIGKSSPKGDESKKVHYWSRIALSEKTI